MERKSQFLSGKSRKGEETVSKWGWPQIVIAALLALNLYNELLLHGQPETGKHNFWPMLFAVAFEIIVLKAGGFF